MWHGIICYLLFVCLQSDSSDADYANFYEIRQQLHPETESESCYANWDEIQRTKLGAQKAVVPQADDDADAVSI